MNSFLEKEEREKGREKERKEERKEGREKGRKGERKEAKRTGAICSFDHC